jgi:hypothetical protein
MRAEELRRLAASLGPVAATADADDIDAAALTAVVAVLVDLLAALPAAAARVLAVGPFADQRAAAFRVV